MSFELLNFELLLFRILNYSILNIELFNLSHYAYLELFNFEYWIESPGRQRLRVIVFWIIEFIIIIIILLFTVVTTIIIIIIILLLLINLLLFWLLFFVVERGNHITPSPPTKSLGFRGFDSSKLWILKGGNSHVHWIL